jgi:hypothetical protein
VFLQNCGAVIDWNKQMYDILDTVHYLELFSRVNESIPIFLLLVFLRIRIWSSTCRLLSPSLFSYMWKHKNFWRNFITAFFFSAFSDKFKSNIFFINVSKLRNLLVIVKMIIFQHKEIELPEQAQVPNRKLQDFGDIKIWISKFWINI